MGQDPVEDCGRGWRDAFASCFVSNRLCPLRHVVSQLWITWCNRVVLGHPTLYELLDRRRHQVADLRQLRVDDSDEGPKALSNCSLVQVILGTRVVDRDVPGLKRAHIRPGE